jgi:hypothetical protein
MELQAKVHVAVVAVGIMEVVVQLAVLCQAALVVQADQTILFPQLLVYTVCLDLMVVVVGAALMVHQVMVVE